MLSGCTNRLSTPWLGFKDAREAILTDIAKVRGNVRFGLTSSQNRESRRDRFSDRAQEDSVFRDFTISPHCSCDVNCFISCPLFSKSCCPEPECYRLWWDLFNTWWFWSVDSSPPCSSSIIFFSSSLTILKSTSECGWTLQPPLCKARTARGHYLVSKVRRSYPPQTDAAQIFQRATRNTTTGCPALSARRRPPINVFIGSSRPAKIYTDYTSEFWRSAAPPSRPGASAIPNT